MVESLYRTDAVNKSSCEFVKPVFSFVLKHGVRSKRLRVFPASLNRGIVNSEEKCELGERKIICDGFGSRRKVKSELNEASSAAIFFRVVSSVVCFPGNKTASK